MSYEVESTQTANYQKCPHCGSSEVKSLGSGHAFGNQPTKWSWQCSVCKHTFSLPSNSITVREKQANP